MIGSLNVQLLGQPWVPIPSGKTTLELPIHNSIYSAQFPLGFAINMFLSCVLPSLALLFKTAAAIYGSYVVSGTAVHVQCVSPQ